MIEKVKFQTRLRVHIGNALTTDEPMIVARVAGREVEIRSQAKDETLRETKWVVMTAAGFDTEEEAQAFGEQLRTIASITGICTRIGVDVGEDCATHWVNEEWVRSLGLIKVEERVHPNVHGLIVVPDDGLSRCPLANASMTVTSDPASLLASINELGENVPISVTAANAGMRILNLALMSSEPLTKVVLAISGIEALGQEEQWTEKQITLMTRLASEVENAGDAGDEEKEVADALRRGLHRIGLRQGVLRVFGRLGLNHLKKEWDRLYSIRSGVFHGINRLSETEIHELAQAAITLCGKVLIALLRKDGVPVPAGSEEHYK